MVPTVGSCGVQPCSVYGGRTGSPAASQSKKLDGLVSSPTWRPGAPWIQKKLESESAGRWLAAAMTGAGTERVPRLASFSSNFFSIQAAVPWTMPLTFRMGLSAQCCPTRRFSLKMPPRGHT